MVDIISIILLVTICYISFVLSFKKIKTKAIIIPNPKYNTSNFKDKADKFFKTEDALRDNISKFYEINPNISNNLPNIKGYCKDCSYKYIDGKYSMCKRLDIIITPKFYCKDFKSS